MPSTAGHRQGARASIMKHPLTLAALMQGCAMFVAASGLLTTSLSVLATETGFAPLAIGLVMAAYFFGYVIGTFVCPDVITQVGHVRAFSVFAAIGAATALLHALFIGIVSWALLRLATGVCLAGLFMTTESWLNAETEPSLRGRVFAIYQIISLLAIALGQWLLLLQPESASTPFLLCGLLFALALVPTALAQVRQPASVPRVPFEIRHVWSISPLGVLGTMTAGVANSTFFAHGPVYAAASGWSVVEIAAFMSTVIVGGVALQWPIGHLSDRFDRRGVILLTSVAAAVVAGVAVLSQGTTTWLFYAAAFLYGGFSFSMYPLSVAHSNDRAVAGAFLRTASALLLVYGLGATAGPTIAGLVIGLAGTGTFFSFLLAAYATMSAIVVIRIVARPRTDAENRNAFLMLNRTSQSALSMVQPSGDAADTEAASPSGEDNNDARRA
jgi:MFS family permease